jgi:hypothetical protein
MLSDSMRVCICACTCVLVFPLSTLPIAVILLVGTPRALEARKQAFMAENGAVEVCVCVCTV